MCQMERSRSLALQVGSESTQALTFEELLPTNTSASTVRST